MLESVKNKCVSIKTNIDEARSYENYFKTKVLIASIPVIGTILNFYNDYRSSKELLSAIKDKDQKNCVRLINIKNCHKIYQIINFIVLFGILAITEQRRLEKVACCVCMVIIPIFNIFLIEKSYEAIHKIQNQNYHFLVDDHSKFPIPRITWGPLPLIFKIEAALQNKATHEIWRVLF